MGIADLSTHQNVITTIFEGIRNRFFAAAGNSQIGVMITSGLQAGAYRQLRLTEMLIGSGEGNDLILIDPGAVEEHVALVFERSFFGSLVDLTAIGPDVLVSGRACEPGVTLTSLRLPLDILIASTSVTLDRPTPSSGDAPAPKPAQKRMRFLPNFDPIVSLAVSSLVLLLAGSMAFALSSFASESYAVSTNDDTQERIMKTQILRDWSSELEVQMDDLNLSGELNKKHDINGLISIGGTIPESKLASLRSLQLWYDAQPGAPTVVWNIQRKNTLDDMPSVMMVRLSQPQQILLATGDAVNVGDVLIDDWVLSQIDDAKMILSRGSEQTIVEYRELIE